MGRFIRLPYSAGAKRQHGRTWLDMRTCGAAEIGVELIKAALWFKLVYVKVSIYDVVPNLRLLN